MTAPGTRRTSIKHCRPTLLFNHLSVRAPRSYCISYLEFLLFILWFSAFPSHSHVNLLLAGPYGIKSQSLQLDSSGIASPCCAPGDGCTATGFCYGADNSLYRGSCTDPSWKSYTCPYFSTGSCTYTFLDCITPFSSDSLFAILNIVLTESRRQPWYNL